MRKLLLIIMIGLCCSINAQTISEQLTTISNTKAAIKANIESSGIIVGDAPLSDYATKIHAMATGTRIITGQCSEAITAGDVVYTDSILVNLTDSPATSPTSLVRAIAFNADGSKMVTGEDGVSYAGILRSYTYNSTTGQYDIDAAPDSMGTGNEYFGVALSDDGNKLIVSRKATPFFQSYTWSSGNNRYEIDSLPNSAPSDDSWGCALSGDGTRAVLISIASTYMYTYVWDSVDNRYEISTKASTLPSGAGRSVAMTPDGYTCAVGYVGSGGNIIKVYHWDDVDGRYEPINACDPAPTGTAVRCIAFSEDGSKMITGIDASPWLETYSYNLGNNRYEKTAAALATGTATGLGCSMSADGNFAAIGLANAPYLMHLRWDGVDNRYEIIDDIATRTAAVTRAATLTDDGTRLAIGNDPSPYYRQYTIDPIIFKVDSPISTTNYGSDTMHLGVAREDASASETVDINVYWYRSLGEGWLQGD